MHGEDKKKSKTIYLHNIYAQSSVKGLDWLNRMNLYTCLQKSSMKPLGSNLYLSLLTAADKFKHFDCSSTFNVHQVIRLDLSFCTFDMYPVWKYSCNVLCASSIIVVRQLLSLL